MKDKKQLWLKKMAQHVLKSGLNNASLRPLAKAAGTSDRMLIYHFGSKDNLVHSLMVFLAEELTKHLTLSVKPERATTYGECVSEVMAIFRSDAVQGYIRVWLDVVSAASQGHTQHAEVGAAIVDGFVAWLVTRLPEDEEAPEKAARALLTLIDGMVLLEAVGRRDIAEDAIAWFLKGE